MRKPKTEQDQIDREAADWVIQWEDRERAPAPREQTRWFAWLQRSPRHVQTYLDMAELHERLGRMDPDHRIDVDEWIADRRVPVVDLATSPRPSPRSGERVHKDGINPGYFGERQWSWALAASLTCLAAGLLLWHPGLLPSNTYRTQIGQQSLNHLSDGSVMDLNTRSHAKVQFSKTQRLIELDGEALFTVARDPARPFLVRTHSATVKALGTEFNVYSHAGETRVSVVEGSVQVSPVSNGVTLKEAAIESPPPTAPEPLALSAGETARVVRGRAQKQPGHDVHQDLAWQHQQLVFEDAPLGEVAAEFNRYNDVQFRVDGALGQTKRLSGTFDALHPQSLLLYLKKDRAVAVEQSGREIVVHGR